MLSFSKLKLVSVAVAFSMARLCAATSLEIADGQKLDGTLNFTGDGKIVLTPAGGAERTFTWDQVRAAHFNKAADFKPLPRGWRVEDIGKVIGTASDNNGAFTFTVAGGEQREKKAPPLHYAFRVVPGEPEVVARITEVRGPLGAIGGVMLRENMEPSSGFALLGITGDKHLRFETRENSWGSLNSRDLGVVKLPLWVKIQRLEKEGGLEAFRSDNGSNWVSVARGKLNCRSAPYPENSDHWVPHVYSGLALMAPTNGAEARFQCDDAAVSTRGFFSEYFLNDDFTKLAFARPEKKIEYWWGDRSPAPMLEPERFSVRWTAQLEPKYSEPFHFYAEAGGRLRIDGREISCFTWNEKKDRADMSKDVPLVAGRKYNVQFEFVRRGKDARAARLGWSSRSVQREMISSSVTSYRYTTNTPEENLEGATNFFLPNGIWLRSGSFLVGEITGSDRSASQFAFAGGKPITVLNHRVARLVLRPSRRPIRFELSTNRTGLFLQNGDFMESELEQLNDRNVVMDSVLFGRRSYSRENTQPMAVVLNDIAPTDALMRVSLLDGSRIFARSIRTDGNAVVVQEAIMGDLRVPTSQLQEIRTTAVEQRASK